MTKRKMTNRERGYVTRPDAVKALRELADTLERQLDGNLVKVSMNVWLASEDEPEKVEQHERIA